MWEIEDDTREQSKAFVTFNGLSTFKIAQNSVDMDEAQLFELNDPSPRGLLDYNLILSSDEWRAEEDERAARFASIPLSSITRLDTKLKRKIRDGIPCTHRRKLWFIATGGQALYELTGNPWPTLSSRPPATPFDASQLQFGSQFHAAAFLPSDAVEQFDAFVTIVAMQNPEAKFAPMIPNISFFLLLFMEPPLAYLSIQAMVNFSRDTTHFLATSSVRFAASVFAIRDIISHFSKRVIDHGEHLGVSISRLFLELVPSFFLPFASLPGALTIFDSFVAEGRKVLNRVCTGIFVRSKNPLLRATSSEAFTRIAHEAVSQFQHVSQISESLQYSFKLSLSWA
jgi:hypothetical protein